MKDAGVGNLGLQDRVFPLRCCHQLTNPSAEREALRWIQKYISEFGGDPSKVTLYA